MPAADGATYVVDVVVVLVNVPQADPEQPLPDADQVTPALPMSFVTVATTASVCATVRAPRFGEIVTLTVPPEDVTVMVAPAVLLVSLTDLAVNVTVGLPGSVDGAVYVAVVAVCPESAPQAGAQLLPDWLSAQVTPWFVESLATAAVNCLAVETFTEALVGEMLTDTADVTVMVAPAVLLVSLTDLAVNVTVGLPGSVDGAVYVAVVAVCPESAPQAGAQLLPDWLSAQVTPWFVESLATAAVNCLAVEMFTEALVGEMLTDTGSDSETVIVAVALLLLFVTEVAVSVTVAGFGTLLGARYVIGTPDALEVADSVPQALPVHPAPDSLQVTPRFAESLRTVAVNCCVPVPASTLALVGDTLTLSRVCPLLPGAHKKAASPNTSIAVVANFPTGIRFE
jgi:hypothetical protein